MYSCGYNGLHVVRHRAGIVQIVGTGGASQPLHPNECACRKIPASRHELAWAFSETNADRLIAIAVKRGIYLFAESVIVLCPNTRLQHQFRTISLPSVRACSQGGVLGKTRISIARQNLSDHATRGKSSTDRQVSEFSL